MHVDWKDPSDARQLRDRIAQETNAKQRDRYRVVLIAGEGLGEEAELERQQIATALGRSRQFVDQWVGRYRCGGLAALKPRRQKVIFPTKNVRASVRISLAVPRRFPD